VNQILSSSHKRYATTSVIVQLNTLANLKVWENGHGGSREYHCTATELVINYTSLK